MASSVPFNARSRRTRAALLEAARALLEAGGFGALTMAAVAQRAGVTRRTVYLHFASRSELVDELFDYVSDQEGLGPSLAAVWEAGDAEAMLQAWARHLAGFHVRALAVTRASEQVHRRDPDAAAHRRRYLTEQLGVCRRLMDRLAEEGRLSATWPPEVAAEMLWGLISGDMLERLLVERAWTTEAFVERFGSMLTTSFLVPAPRRRT